VKIVMWLKYVPLCVFSCLMEWKLQCMLASDIVTITKMILANVDAVFVSNMKTECVTMVEHFLVPLLNGICEFLSLKLNLRA
jgi:hypothetical protein